MAIPAQRLEKERPRRIVYPVRDGKPMAETDHHADLMVYCKEGLRLYFDRRDDVYVSGNNFVFYEEGNPKARVSPDVYVVFGVPKHRRDSYKAWEEGGNLPSVVFEITSKKTQKEDVRTKRPLYERLGIPEYFQFDPTGDYLKPRLQGFRLKDGKYVPLPLVGGRLHSEQLKLDLILDGEWLLLFDPAAGKQLPNLREENRRAAFAMRLADSEARRAAAEAQLRGMAERLAESEKRRADMAEAEIARLRAEIEALKRQE